MVGFLPAARATDALRSGRASTRWVAHDEQGGGKMWKLSSPPVALEKKWLYTLSNTGSVLCTSLGKFLHRAETYASSIRLGPGITAFSAGPIT